MIFDLKNSQTVQLDCLVLILYLNQKKGFVNKEGGKVLSQLGIKCQGIVVFQGGVNDQPTLYELRILR
jgi:hypothetical protein